MSDPFCRICGRYKYLRESHKCPPRWHVRCADWHGEHDYDTIFGVDAEQAAERWAHERESAMDYIIISGNPAEVFVRKAGAAHDDPWEPFTLTGELVPEYTASEGH